MTRLPPLRFQSITLNCTHEGDGLPGCLICDPRKWAPVPVESAEEVRIDRKLHETLAQLAAETPTGP